MLKPRLQRLFEEYADSHRHPTNRLTHKIAIPLIVFHIIAMLDWVHLFGGVTLAWVAFGVAIGWYLTLDVRLALLMVLLYGACYPLGWFVSGISRWLVVGIAVVAWLIQLAGHLVWEKKQPAFFTNLLQALVGPFFFAAVLVGLWPPKPAQIEAKAG